MKKRFFRNNGFTLLEIAIIIGIMAVLLSGGLSVYRILMVQDYNETTQKRMEEVRAALEKFQIKHNRLPCPAPLHAAPTDPAYGIEATDSCGTGAAQADTTRSGTVRIGALPFATLEISSEHMGDRWGRRLLYAVSEKLADKTIPYDENNGAISFKDSTGNLVPTKTPFVVLSFGKDGRGAVSMAGKDLEPCPAAGPMQENCNNDDIFSGAEYSESESDTNRFTHLALNGFDFDTTTACGSKGMFYGPTHPQRDAEGCVNSLSTPIDDTAALDVKGMIRIGDDPSVCDAASEGVLRYNPATQRNEYCNGTQWKVMGTPPNTWITVSGGNGGSHFCGLKTNGSAWCWGYNNYGQLGNGTLATSLVPSKVAGSDTWIDISASSNFACGIKSDRSTWCWGNNVYGQLGNNSLTNSSVPVKVDGGFEWKDISVGGVSACGLRTDDVIMCWGSASGGMLGNGQTSPNRKVPMRIADGGAATWKSIGGSNGSAGATCGIRSDATMWCWGWNDYGALGNGSSGLGTYSATPSLVTAAGGGTWKSVGLGAHHTCAVKTDGKLYCWGWNPSGQIGNSQPLAGIWKTASAGGHHSCGLRDDNTVWCWGSDGFGQLGVNGGGGSTPAQVYNGGLWKHVSVSDWSVCAIKQDGSLWCWGRNDHGMIADGTTTHRNIPTAAVIIP